MDSKDKKHYIRLMLALFGAAVLSTIFFFVVYRFSGFKSCIAKFMGIMYPIIYGAVIAYLLKPMCNFYEAKLEKRLPDKAKRFSNALAVAGSLVTGLVIVYLVLMAIIPQMVNSITTIVNNLPEDLNNVYAWIDKMIESESVLYNYVVDAYGNIQDSIINWTKDFKPEFKVILENVGAKIWDSVLFFKNMFIGIIVAAYMLAARKKFARHGQMLLYAIMKTKLADILLNELKYADEMFVGFINGKILDSAIIGAICYVCCLIFRFPNAMLISVIVGVTNIIPFFGPFIGAIPSALIIFIESPIMSFWFVIFIIGLQQADGNVIGPKILGNTTGLSSIWVLFSILVFGGLWGFIGMIIGVPLFAVIYDVCRKLAKIGLRKNGRTDLIEEFFGETEE